jgi:hypothetical protein
MSGQYTSARDGPRAGAPGPAGLTRRRATPASGGAGRLGHAGDEPVDLVGVV